MAYQTVKGTYDILIEDYDKYAYLEALFKNFLDIYNYKLIKTPIFEYTNVFKKDNDTSDMVTKEMYTFSLNNKDFLTLRPEGTAGVIRSVVEHKMYGSYELPLKLAYMGEMFRHERPQKGRQRQFNQMGIECLGEKSPMIDAEVIALGYNYIKALGLNGIKVCVNTLGDNDSRLNYKKALKDYFIKYKDSLCTDCQNRLEKNPLRILDCKIDHNQEFMNNAPKMSDYLTETASEYFKKVLAYLNALNIPYVIDEKLVRGLDYYTDTVFEVISTNEANGAQATIFGGGRYDNLVKEMGGPELSGIGFAIGEERLVILGEAEEIFGDYKEEVDAYVIDMTDSSDYAFKLVTNLRNNGYASEINYYNRSMKSQFKSSERKNARFILIVGEDEIKNNKVTIKDSIDKSQDSVNFDDVINYLDKKMGVGEC